MWSTLQFILLIGSYILSTYFIIKFISKWTVGIRPYLRLLALSFLYASFWGIGIAGSGGDPGFGFPAPNIVAIVLMFSNGFYRGVETGAYILGFWWLIIFTVLFIRNLSNKKGPEFQHNQSSK